MAAEGSGSRVVIIGGDAAGMSAAVQVRRRRPCRCGKASASKAADVLATAISAGMTTDDVADLDLAYAPYFAPVWDPILQAANRPRL